MSSVHGKQLFIKDDWCRFILKKKKNPACFSQMVKYTCTSSAVLEKRLFFLYKSLFARLLSTFQWLSKSQDSCLVQRISAVFSIFFNHLNCATARYNILLNKKLNAPFIFSHIRRVGTRKPSENKHDVMYAYHLAYFSVRERAAMLTML